MKISELEAGQGKASVEGTITEIGPVKEFTKFGKQGRVATAILEDDSGKISLTLWDEQIDAVQEGSKVRIENGYVKDWQGEKQLNVGRFGKMEIL